VQIRRQMSARSVSGHRMGAPTGVADGKWIPEIPFRPPWHSNDARRPLEINNHCKLRLFWD